MSQTRNDPDNSPKLSGSNEEARAVAKPLELFEADCTAGTGDSVGKQMLRRRAASLRCEPLPDGRRDPWTTRKATGLRSLHVEVGRRTAWLYGDKVFALLDDVGIEQRQWSPTERVWMIPVQHADDVMAFAEWRQRRVVTCEAVER
jgi:hypothetical protein